MKKNDEQILKYLSGLMNQDEKILFEREMSSSSELKKDFDNIEQEFKKLLEVKDIAVNETYFANLTPRVKEKLKLAGKKSWYAKLYYVVPVTAAVLVAIMFWPREEITFNDHTAQLTSEIVNNLDDEQIADKVFSEVYNTDELLIDTKDENIFSVALPEEITITKSKLFSEIDIAYFDYSVLDEISDEEINSIYQKINK
ncbi:MAG: hypothetical protein AB1521_05345 [Bacteroidota bacterium]